MVTIGKTDRALSAALTAAAVIMAAAVAYREFAPATSANASAKSRPTRAEYYADWRSLLKSSNALDSTKASVHIIEFGDLECPACRQFHQQTLYSVVDQFKGQVTVNFIHLPLTIHRFAAIAAKASECAAQQGHFGAFVRATYAKQDSLGLKSWSSLARESRLPDTVLFAKCLAQTPRPPLLDSGLLPHALASKRRPRCL